MLLTIITGVAVIACGYFLIAIDKLFKRMLLLNQRLQNLEAEIYMTVVKTEMPDKQVVMRMTLCGAVQKIKEMITKKSQQSKIIIPR